LARDGDGRIPMAMSPIRHCPCCSGCGRRDVQEDEDDEEFDRFEAPSQVSAALEAVLQSFPKRRVRRFKTWLPGPLQVVMAAKPPEDARDLPPPEREVVALPDGGRVAVDWVGGPRPAGGGRRPPALVVLGLPGIGASSSSGLLGACAAALAVRLPDARVGTMVAQGLDGLPLETRAVMATPYFATDDIGVLLSHIAGKYPGVPIVIFANSFGVGLFVRWAGQNPQWCKEANVIGGVMLCFGYSVATTSRAGDKTLATPTFVLGHWRASVQANEKWVRSLEGQVDGFCFDKLMAASTIAEWEEAACPLYGFSGRDAMLQSIETEQASHSIEIPMIYIGSDDDPITPATRLLANSMATRAHSAVLCTRGGGHMGWWEGPLWRMHQTWIFRVVTDLVRAFAAAAVPTGGEELRASSEGCQRAALHARILHITSGHSQPDQ